MQKYLFLHPQCCENGYVHENDRDQDRDDDDYHGCENDRDDAAYWPHPQVAHIY